jgi:hypothetical protein
MRVPGDTTFDGIEILSALRSVAPARQAAAICRMPGL